MNGGGRGREQGGLNLFGVVIRGRITNWSQGDCEGAPHYWGTGPGRRKQHPLSSVGDSPRERIFADVSVGKIFGTLVARESASDSLGNPCESFP